MAEGIGSLAARRPILTLILAVAAGAGLMAAIQALRPPGQLVTLTPSVETVLNDPGSPRDGPADAAVTVVVFTDYQCSVCKLTDPALERLTAEQKDVAVVYKDWPILGPASAQAARAALASREQDGYLAFHRALMNARVRLSPPVVEALAASVRLDVARLAADQQRLAPAIEAQLQGHGMQAFSLGIRGTPAYLVGPYLIHGKLDDGALRRAVRAARKSGPPKAPEF